ncbi:hypothetical protein RM549_14170 [Salegentibacter sp. F188]|uniref:TonB-dependent receptor n=1 Tax=Autumnicola patrickiae TaxID=3075591 RepID=A0ABU3E4N6_9FLAO|nr:hypothetical protein [Salegentibacter sp. F188]MDT0690939.1 hypothetical protein [Salegentibacter sp. F188]
MNKYRVKDIFKDAYVHGHVRNFFLTTNNQGGLKDYYTNATGGAIGIITGNHKGFEIGVKNIFTYQTFGGNLKAKDVNTGYNAKWEYELYDVLNKGNYNNINRLDELFLRYRFKKSYLSLGRLKPEYTPLLNQSDGRMMPFSHRGFWGHFNFHPRHTFNVGWLDGVAPRATTEWFDLEEGIGLFNNGYQPNGEKADYYKFYPSKGIGIITYRYLHKNFKIALYDFYIDKLNNTFLTEVGYNVMDFNLGLQVVYQTPLQFSEDLPYENRYVQPKEHGQVISSQLGWGNKIFKFAFAYTHAFDTGRFLFPKELGRDRLFTSISRSRLEGLGGVDVVTFKSEFRLLKPELHVSIDLQKLTGLEAGQTTLNKYKIYETFQANTRITYTLQGFLDGLTLDLLWVYRVNQNIKEAERIFNKSDFNQFSFVTNFYF